ncbi:MAG: methyltransferase family protein [Terriglobales bacterium]
MKLNFGSLAVVLVAVAVYLWRAPGLTWTPWHIAGVAMVLPAFVLFVLARIQLGSAFSVQAKASRLVTTGIYARIRNPIYVFGGVMVAGAIIGLQRPWLLLIFLVLIPMQVLRVRREEQVLEATFGEAYAAYKRATWF